VRSLIDFLAGFGPPGFGAQGGPRKYRLGRFTILLANVVFSSWRLPTSTRLPASRRWSGIPSPRLWGTVI
jgi:hypothetical protein